MVTKGNGPVLSAKVSEKGAVCLYGVRQKFPITFYADEWDVILEAAPKIRAFIKTHKGELKEAKQASGGPSGATAL